MDDETTREVVSLIEKAATYTDKSEHGIVTLSACGFLHLEGGGAVVKIIAVTNRSELDAMVKLMNSDELHQAILSVQARHRKQAIVWLAPEAEA